MYMVAPFQWRDQEWLHVVFSEVIGKWFCVVAFLQWGVRTRGFGGYF